MTTLIEVKGKWQKKDFCKDCEQVIERHPGQPCPKCGALFMSVPSIIVTVAARLVSTYDGNKTWWRPKGKLLSQEWEVRK